MHHRVKDKSTKIQEPACQYNILEVQSSGSCQDIPPKLKDQLLHPTPPLMKKEAQYQICLFRFWRQHSLHLRSIQKQQTSIGLSINTPLCSHPRGWKHLASGALVNDLSLILQFLSLEFWFLSFSYNCISSCYYKFLRPNKTENF